MWVVEGPLPVCEVSLRYLLKRRALRTLPMLQSLMSLPMLQSLPTRETLLESGQGELILM